MQLMFQILIYRGVNGLDARGKAPLFNPIPKTSVAHFRDPLGRELSPKVTEGLHSSRYFSYNGKNAAFWIRISASTSETVVAFIEIFI